MKIKNVTPNPSNTSLYSVSSGKSKEITISIIHYTLLCIIPISMTATLD